MKLFLANADDYNDAYPLRLPDQVAIRVQPVDGGYIAHFQLSPTYEKWVLIKCDMHSALDRANHAAVEAQAFYEDLLTLNRKFMKICFMDDTQNFSDSQTTEWFLWVADCDAMVSRWEKGNIPATLRTWINAVERNLEGRAMTDFRDDRFGTGDLGVMFEMNNFDNGL